MNSLPEKEVGRKAVIIPLWKKVASWTAVAAILGGVLFLTGIFDLNKMPNQNEIAVTSESAMTSGIASSDEEDYLLFIEDEVDKVKFKEVFYNN